MTSNTVSVEETSGGRGSGDLQELPWRERLREAGSQLEHLETVARKWTQEHPLASVAAAAAAGYIIARFIK